MPPGTPPPQVQFDWQDWLPAIEDSDLSLDQKRQMIETLCTIVVAFVDLGWEVSESSQESCGQTLDLRAALSAALLQSKNGSETDKSGTPSREIGTDDAA